MNHDPDKLIDALSEEFVAKSRAGENPLIEEYVARHPELEERIRAIFPSIAMMENLGRQQHHDLKIAQSAATEQKLPFERLGDFQIVREVGRGGMGVVFEAVQSSLDRNVAVKVLSNHALLDEKHIQRFEREARTAAKLHHTNIVPVFGVGQADGYFYIVMQLIDGVSLDLVLKSYRRWITSTEQPHRSDLLRYASQSCRHERTPRTEQDSIAETMAGGKSTETAKDWNEQSSSETTGHDDSAIHKLDLRHFISVANIGLQVARGLDYAHRKGILHRDVKPGNLLIDENENVWIVDFGLAKGLGHDDVTRTNDIVGTLRYMAPEQVHTGSEQRSDIYSLGLTLYELLTLQPAFDDRDIRRNLRPSQSVEVLRPSKLLPNLPVDLETIVLKCCAMQPQNRYASAADVADDLYNFVNGLPIHARPWTNWEKLTRWYANNTLVGNLAAATASLLLLLVAVGGVGYQTTQVAYKREQQERARAEQTLKTSVESMNRVFDSFVPRGSTYQLQISDDQDDAISVSIQPTVSNETAVILEELLAFYEQFSEQYQNRVELKRSFARAKIKIADIRLLLGQWQAAEAAYLDAIDSLRFFADRVGDDQSIVEFATLYHRLGDAYLQKRKTKDAIAAYRSALQFLESKLDGATSDTEIKFQIAKSWYLIGKAGIPNVHGPAPSMDHLRRGIASWVGKKRRRTERRANTELDRAIEILDSILVENPAHKFLYALCLRDQPIFYEEGLEQALQLLGELSQQWPHQPEYKFALVDAYVRMSKRCQTHADKIAHLRTALILAKELVDSHSNVPKYELARTRVVFDLVTVMSRPSQRMPISQEADSKSSFRENQRHIVKEADALLEEAVLGITNLVELNPTNKELALLLSRAHAIRTRIQKRHSHFRHPRSSPPRSNSED